MLVSEVDEVSMINNLENEIGEEAFEWGTHLIEEDDFEEYARECCYDWGLVSADNTHWIEIDWKATADNFRQDYSEVEFNNRTYYYSN